MERPDEGTKSSVADPDWYDTETGLHGPRFWSSVLAVEAARCSRYGRTATVVVVDVTGFEDRAAAWGSDVEAVAVARVGKIVRSGSRSSDYLARLGPCRFAVLLPETDEVAAVNFVERVRASCDDALRAVHPRARCTFGWADATKARPLGAAADEAQARLATDRVVGRDQES